MYIESAQCTLNVYNVHWKCTMYIPSPHSSPSSPRLGAGSKTTDCTTCSLPLAECIGHYGYIQLQLPVFHIGYFKTITQILQCICKSCSAVLLPTSEKNKYQTMFKRLNMNRITQKNLMKKVQITKYNKKWTFILIYILTYLTNNSLFNDC